MISKFVVVMSLLVCLAAVAEMYHHHHPYRRYRVKVDRKDASGKTVVSKDAEQFIDLETFLKGYCKGARGNYERCQRCVAVACLRTLEHANQIKEYEDCIDKHNRCCGEEGVNAENVQTALLCYGTGTYDSFITGELSTIQALIGSQKGLKDLDVKTRQAK